MPCDGFRLGLETGRNRSRHSHRCIVASRINRMKTKREREREKNNHHNTHRSWRFAYSFYIESGETMNSWHSVKVYNETCNYITNYSIYSTRCAFCLVVVILCQHSSRSPVRKCPYITNCTFHLCHRVCLWILFLFFSSWNVQRLRATQRIQLHWYIIYLNGHRKMSFCLQSCAVCHSANILIGRHQSAIFNRCVSSHRFCSRIRMANRICHGSLNWSVFVTNKTQRFHGEWLSQQSNAAHFAHNQKQTIRTTVDWRSAIFNRQCITQTKKENA